VACRYGPRRNENRILLALYRRAALVVFAISVAIAIASSLAEPGAHSDVFHRLFIIAVVTTIHFASPVFRASLK
jgi:anti-sigma factor RsiW